MLAGSDMVSAVDGRAIGGNRDLAQYVGLEPRVEQAIGLTILRVGPEMTLSLELAEVPRNGR